MRRWPWRSPAQPQEPHPRRETSDAVSHGPGDVQPAAGARAESAAARASNAGHDSATASIESALVQLREAGLRIRDDDGARMLLARIAAEHAEGSPAMSALLEEILDAADDDGRVVLGLSRVPDSPIDSFEDDWPGVVLALAQDLGVADSVTNVHVTDYAQGARGVIHYAVRGVAESVDAEDQGAWADFMAYAWIGDDLAGPDMTGLPLGNATVAWVPPHCVSALEALPVTWG